MSFSSVPLLWLKNVELLPVTAPDVFSACGEMCVAIVGKESESDVIVFRVALNSYDQTFLLRSSV
jgi:hypothetical protein